MLTTKVENMRNPRTGNKVANQYAIIDDVSGQIWFQSYDTIIATAYYNGDIELNYTPEGQYNWDCSATTLKYLKLFLSDYTDHGHMTKKDIQAKIDAGIYKLADLNK